MVGNRKEVDPETRRVFTRLMAQAVTLGFGNVIDWVRGRKDNGSEGEWETMSPERRREMMDAAMNGRTEEPAGQEAVPEEQKEEQKQDKNDP